MRNAVEKLGYVGFFLIFLFQYSCSDNDKLEALLSDDESPTKVVGLAASNIKTESLQLSWNASTDNVKVTNYEIYQNGESIGLSGGQTTFEVTGLTPNTTYEFTATALDGEDNASTMSDAISVTTAEEEDTEKPTPPTNVGTSNITTNTLELSWDASEDNVEVTDYEVFQNGTSIGKTEGALSMQITGLAASTEYEFYVVAEDMAGNISDASQTVSATTLTDEDTEAPTVPTNVQASNITSTSLELTWDASTDNEAVSVYEVFQDGVSIGTTADTFMEVTGLDPDTAYEFTVSATDASGNTSALSDVYSITTDATPVTSSVIDIIVERDDLSSLQSTLESLGMDAVLEEDGPFTVFAPNNAAFTAYGTLPTGILLNQLIASHVVSGDISTQELVQAGTVTNGLGTQITITTDADNNIILNGEAVIVVKDIKATNGTVHIIDAIIPLEQ